MICILMLSNLLIDKSIYKKNPELINEIILIMENHVVNTNFQNQYLNVGFLKLLHNLIISQFEVIHEPQIKKSI
jgi:hypothetical protein